MRYNLYACNSNNAFGIDSIGYSDDKLVTRFGPAKRNNYIIHYVLSGQGCFNNHIVKKGQGFLITPGMAEHYYPDKKTPWEFLWIILNNSENNKTIFKEYNANPETNIFEYNNIYKLVQIRDIIIKNNGAIYSSSELFEIFLHIFNNHNITKNEKKDAETMYYNYAVNFINSNIFRKITVDELTDILGISQPYLYRIFIKKCSMSPKNYIDKIKIQKAMELLLETYMPLTEIAHSIGIEDGITLSKFFKKKTGLSPTEFKKNNT